MNYIVEGPRGSGKTTFLKKKNVRVFKDTSYYTTLELLEKGLVSLDIDSTMIGKDLAFLQMLNYINDIWFDRLFLSTIVYSSVYRNCNIKDMLHIYNNILQSNPIKHNTQIVLILHTEKTLDRFIETRHLRNKKDGFNDTRENILLEQDSYLQIYDYFRTRLNFTKLCAE